MSTDDAIDVTLSTTKAIQLVRSFGPCHLCPSRGDQPLVNGLCPDHLIYGVPATEARRAANHRAKSGTPNSTRSRKPPRKARP